jgi:succinate dehydrogenase/fumarate reductase flavoprotein subunit
MTAATEDVHCDVLVIGSGAAGFAAALAARAEGLDVLMIEKRARLGGTTARSGGWLWVPGNRQGVSEGDTRSEVRAYVQALAGDSFDAESVDHFLDEVPRAMDFFESKTAVEFIYPEAAPDYRMDSPGARESGRAVTVKRINARVLGKDRLRVEPYLSTYTVFGYMPEIGGDIPTFLRANRSLGAFLYVARKLGRTWIETLLFRRGLARTNGNALTTRLVLSAQRAGIPMWTSAPAKSLIQSETGRVVGAVVGSGASEIKVLARAGVVLAAGGFAGDTELRKRYFAHDRSGLNHSTATIGHEGDAIRLAAAVGAEPSTRPHQPAAWAPVTVWENLRGRPMIFPHLRAFALPGLVAVNPHGRRFANESSSYHDFGIEMQKHSSRDERTFGFIIADRRAMHKYGIGYAKPWPIPTWYFRRVGFMTKAKTLGQLAAKIGVPADQLIDTISRFNENAATGEDPDFRRGSTRLHHFKGDLLHRPNPNLAPIVRPPFYAVPIRVGDLGTYVGIPTSPQGQVLRTDGTPVAGLYAAGTAAESIFGGGYPGYGAMIGPAMVLGYQVGRDLHRTASPVDDNG